MRKFIYKVVLFLLPFLACMGAFVLVVVELDFAAFKSNVKDDGEYQYLVAGDSLTECGLDPAFFGDLRNFSSSGSRMDTAYFRTRECIRLNPGRYKRLIIDVSCRSCCFDDKIETLSGTEHVEMHALLLLRYFPELRRKFGSIGGLFCETMMPRGREMWKCFKRRRAYHSLSEGGYNGSDVRGKEDHPEKFKVHQKDQSDRFNASGMVNDDSPCLFWAGKIAKLAAAEGVRPVLYTSPICGSLLNELDPVRVAALTNGVYRLSVTLNCPYVNMLGFDPGDECWRDSVHLNDQGARALTERVKAALSELTW